MRPPMFSILAIICVLSAVRVVRTTVSIGLRQNVDLAGLWFERRTVLGMGILTHRFFDVVRQSNDTFRAFPITKCTPEESWFGRMRLGRVPCDEEILISLVANSSIGVGQVATKTTLSTTVVANLEENGENQLQWSDGTIWELHTDAITLLDDWDDEECRALSGAASTDPIAYELFGGTSAALGFSKVPGLTLDMFACLQNDWLYKYRARFECILEKASQGSDQNATARSAMLAKVLGKLGEVMPKDDQSVCVPTVCIGVAVTKFPIPSPVPSISVFFIWPMVQDQCNGADIRDAINEVQKERKSATAAVQDLQHALFNGLHGSSFGVFPVPDVAYFAMGTVHTSGLFRGYVDTEKLLEESQRAAAEIDNLILDAIYECPALRKRFELHAQSEDVKASLRLSKSDVESRRIIAKSFPELSSSTTHKSAHLGLGAGTYGQVGTHGVAAGVFGGGTFKCQSLGKKYRGCLQWRQVLKLWYNSPLSEMDREQLAALNTQMPLRYNGA
eukprot:TRINITY_DN5558_c0_g2_i1.p1 TRINITY_DN5558_c0_g2~~TRINITY_DN5558_c0_g2_i1.p1  ORF type:complete len:504 (-),score=38.97 TRINITY_DN5558_c0_g2_i1:362-1873(-)